jgi:Flp pilus assembly CpaF family ATPase
MSELKMTMLEPPVDQDGGRARKQSALRVLRMLETAMGPTIAGLLKDPDVIEIRCNADGKIYADWFDRPSSWTGQRLASDMATQVVCIVADAVDQIVGPAANRYILDAEFPGQGFRLSSPRRASTFASGRRASSRLTNTSRPGS